MEYFNFWSPYGGEFWRQTASVRDAWKRWEDIPIGSRLIYNSEKMIKTSAKLGDVLAAHKSRYSPAWDRDKNL